MKFDNDNEQTLWVNILVAYVQQGGDTYKGAHLKFADRCIEALRKRQPDKEQIETQAARAAAPFVHGDRSAKELAAITTEAMRQQPGKKIQQIKYVREHAGLGLKEAKDLVEAVARVLGHEY